LFAFAKELLAAELSAAPFRLIGAGLSDLVDAAEGLDLFAEDERRARRGETAVDALRSRFGSAAVVSGRSLKREE
jgi:DNA polymerase-4